MPIDTRDWYREKYGYRPPHSHRSYRPPRGKVPLGKIFLIFLLVACVVAIAYTGYLLFTHQTNWVVGAIVLTADIGVLIWNISVLRKYRVGVGAVISILVVIVLLGATISAFAGVEPFSDAKAEVVAWFQKVGSHTPTLQSPPASEYPADISGHVIIAEKVIAKYGRNKADTIELGPLEGKTYWIVDISVKNKSYENAVIANSSHWKITVGDKVYDAQRPFADIQSAYPMTVPVGEVGETTIRFLVPDTLKVKDAKLCYQGQEPFSYGNLSGGDKVAVYDWDLKEPVREPSLYECPRPDGIYSGSVFGIVATAEFEGNKLILTNSLVGKRVFRYRILPGCEKVELTDVVTGDVKVHDFKYSKEDEYVCIFTAPEEPIPYWKD